MNIVFGDNPISDVVNKSTSVIDRLVHRRQAKDVTATSETEDSAASKTEDSGRSKVDSWHKRPHGLQCGAWSLLAAWTGLAAREFLQRSRGARTFWAQGAASAWMAGSVYSCAQSSLNASDTLYAVYLKRAYASDPTKARQTYVNARRRLPFRMSAWFVDD